MVKVCIKKSNKKWDYFLAFMFLASSGAIFWHGMSPALAFSVLLIISIINACYVNRNWGKANNKSINFIIFVALLCVLNFLIHESPFEDNSEPAYIVILTATYLIVSRYDFYYFRRILTNVVFVITLFGLIFFALYEIGMLPTQSLTTHSGSQYTMFAIYTLGWPNSFHRYTGIWHEAGACQIINNTILWLHLRNFSEWKWEKGQLVKICVVFLGSIFTFSTGSYMVLMLLIAAVIINSKIRSRYKPIIYVCVYSAAALGLFVMFNSPVVQNKLFDVEGEHVSKLARLSDINALWRMTMERPLLGYGLGTVDFWKMSSLYGNTACSSGFLTYSASLGLTWMYLFLLFIWKGIKRFNLGKSTIFLFVTIILMQFNEKFIEYPITNMMLFYFASYNNSICLSTNVKK